jgi:hypothetical protein
VAKPKSFLKRIEVDVAQRAHDCQHNPSHRLERGDKRLKLTVERTTEHFCVACALKFIALDQEKLQQIVRELVS